MAIRTKRRVLAAKIETIAGTAETLAAGDGGLLVSDLKWDMNIEMVARDYMKDDLGRIKPVPGKRSGSFSFTTEIRGKNAAFSALNVPEVGKYLQACGFSETVDTTADAETVTYEPTSDQTAMATLTMALYNDGRRILLSGCRGNVQIEANNGKYGKLMFTFQGVIESVADAAQLVVDLSGEVGLNPPLLLGTSFSLNDGSAYSAKISSLSVDMGNTVTMREDMSAAHGYAYPEITERNPTGSIDPELDTETNYPFLGNFLSGVSAAISFSAGTVQYNRFEITIPTATTTAVGDSERESLATADLSFELNSTTGDDEISIVFS
jgi:hypothetical protein